MGTVLNFRPKFRLLVPGTLTSGGASANPPTDITTKRHIDASRLGLKPEMQELTLYTCSLEQESALDLLYIRFRTAPSRSSDPQTGDSMSHTTLTRSTLLPRNDAHSPKHMSILIRALIRLESWLESKGI